ncbi:MAG TPA: hypothetical protein VF006_33640 [Longimicrobium sp.]
MNMDRVRVTAASLLLLTVAACGAPLRRQPPQCPTGNAARTIGDTMVIHAAPSQARMGRHLQVWLQLPAPRPDLKDLQLFIDGHPVPGLEVRQIGARCALRASGKVVGYVETYEFMPVRNAQSKATWAHLLGSPDSYLDTVRVGAGLANGPEFKTNPVRDSTEVVFEVIDRNMFGGVSVVFVLLLALLVWAGIKTTILRDAHPVPPAARDQEVDPAARAADPAAPDPEPAPKPPYSLAKVVMAMWTFLILGGYFAIWLITGDHLGIFTTQALLLLGITGVSTAASVAITKQKNEQLAQQARALHLQRETLRHRLSETAAQLRATAHGTDDLKQSAALSQEMVALTDDARMVNAAIEAVAKQAPGAKNFFVDLISDANGPALYRFQNLLWNVALAIVFVVGTYRTLAFPHFDDALMALLGISEALYLGVKITSPGKPPTDRNQQGAQAASAWVNRLLVTRRGGPTGPAARTGGER